MDNANAQTANDASTLTALLQLVEELKQENAKAQKKMRAAEVKVQEEKEQQKSRQKKRERRSSEDGRSAWRSEKRPSKRRSGSAASALSSRPCDRVPSAGPKVPLGGRTMAAWLESCRTGRCWTTCW
jgi:hypothetical protein